MGLLRAAVALLGARARAARRIELAPGARIERDLAYGSDPAQRLDVYLPPGRPSGSLLAIVHGGAWSIGDKANPGVVAAKVNHWLSSGCVLASLNYRLLPQAGPLEQAQDVARALALLQRQAGTWGADPSRLVVIAHSSGAHLVALLAVDDELRRQHGNPSWRATVLLDSAALDVVGAMQAPHRPFFDRAFGSLPSDWQLASPLHRLHASPAPMLIVHAADRADSAGQAARFSAAVTAAGGRADMLPVSLSHTEINVTLGEPGDYTDQVDAFLRSVGVP